MLRIVACDSRRAVTMPRRSPPSSVTPADSIATSVPVPIAIPTSAAASAGASLTPSPAMATTRPSFRRPFDQPCPCPAAELPPRFRRCRAGGATASAVARLSPVSITTRTPAVLERAKRVGRGRLDRVGDRHHAGRLAVDRREDRGRALAPQIVRRRFERADVDADRLHHRAIAKGDACAPRWLRPPLCPGRSRSPRHCPT